MRRVIVIGAGIVGTSLAREFAADAQMGVTVLEQAAGAPRGSTGFAPGFVGLYNDVPILVELARRSAEVYESVGAGFRRAGGVELATTAGGLVEAERRSAEAALAGLESRMLGPNELPDSIATWVEVDRVLGASWYPGDGVAEPVPLTGALRRHAEAGGARFVGGQRVVGIDIRGGDVVVSTAGGEQHAGDDVVLAGGIWGPTLASMVGVDLPLFPVAHPYVYSDEGPWNPGRFIRWPEHHVYARVHGRRLGIGSYDHAPLPVDQSQLEEGAGLPWVEQFDPVIENAQLLLRPEARFEAAQRTNGVFAMTPDNLPFLGPHPTLPGVWIAQAIWVTHAAGAAVMLAAAMREGTPVTENLSFDRFNGRGLAELSDAAYRLYRDIYANNAG